MSAPATSKLVTVMYPSKEEYMLVLPVAIQLSGNWRIEILTTAIMTEIVRSSVHERPI